MRILLLYDNFVRDYRGLLLLSEFLKSMGNKVWIKAGWTDPFSFALLHNIDVLVTGQIAESSTYKFGEFCKQNNISLVLNSSEPVVSENDFYTTIIYNSTQINQDIIDFQLIGITPVLEYINSNEKITSVNKAKYKLLGFPRTDISFNSSLRITEEQEIIRKYNLKDYQKKYLFISSFLLDGAYDGVSDKDFEVFNIKDLQNRTIELLDHTSRVLKKFVAENMSENDVLLIKKHPWDCSSYFADNFSSKNCIILSNYEYITPCIGVADLVLHTFSTSAIEAWIMNKPTVSIYLEKHMDIALLHMKHERIAYNYEQLNNYINTSFNKPNLNSSDLFDGFMDGKATFRLAKEINNLKAKQKDIRKISSKQRLKSLIKYQLFDYGFNKVLPESMAEQNTKLYDLISWENQRSFVNNLYKKPIKNFVREFIKSIKHERKDFSQGDKA